MDELICGQRTLAGLAANRNLGDQQGEAEGQRQDQIDQQEQTAAVFGGQIGKTPDITKTYSAACRRQDKTQTAGEAAAIACILHGKNLQNGKINEPV